MNLPFISIIIAVFNSERTLEKCLKSIRNQDYPQEKIEIILVDAGSIDNTLLIGKKYNCKIIQKLGVLAEAAKSYGIKEAKGEFIADFGSDNILIGTDWLKKIIAPFQEDKEIIASYPLYYTYRKKDSIFNRYVALFGVNDPVPFYLGKADRQSYLYKNNYYALAGRARDCGSYYKVEFASYNLPTVGANGFVIKKSILGKAQTSPEKYFHIDVVYDLVKLGYNKFAVVKTSIIHDTADTLFSLIAKRSRYFQEFYLKQKKMRRYHLITRKDYPKLALFIFYSLIFVQPFLVSLRGYLSKRNSTGKRDIAWFIHPIFCFLITLVYAKEVVRSWLDKVYYHATERGSIISF